jgi:hypothetical protein
MTAFQMTPGGIAPLNVDGDDAPNPGATTIVAGGAFVASLQAQRDGAHAPPPLSPPAAAKGPKSTDEAALTPTQGLGPRGVVKAAKARIKELKRILRQHNKLKAELAELERLVAAAQTPAAPVRAISSARSSA